MTKPHHASCVAIAGRGVLIEGPPGIGKSSLTLALMDRGATLVGDDGVLLRVQDGEVLARPHPNIRGKLEVRNLGLLDFPVVEDVPIALVVRLDGNAPRFIDQAEIADIAAVAMPMPMVRLWPDSPVLALRTELALLHYGRKVFFK